VTTHPSNKNLPSPISILKKIIFYLDSKRKKQLFLVFILSIFSSLAESISIAMLIPFINFFISPELYLFNGIFKNIFNFLDISNNKEILALISSLFVITVILSGYIRLKYIKISNQVTDNITSDFRIKIFNFLLNQDYSYHFKHGSNEIMSNMTQKTISLATLIFSSLNILNSIIISGAIILILLFNEPFYTSIIITTIGLFFFLIFKIKSSAIFARGQKVNLNQNFIIDIFENTVGYLPEIIIYNLKNFYLSILSNFSRINAQSNAEIRTISMTPRIYLEVFIIVFVVAFIYFSGFSERPIETNIAYLAILAFGVQKCLPLINSIYHMSVNFKGATPTVLSFLNILENGKKKILIETNYERIKFNKSIKLKDFSYQYEKNLPNVLNKLNIEILKGEKVAIKGETGSGKSTLINVIAGLLDSNEGTFIVDGVVINTKNKKNWQQNISIVPQTIFLNDATILENIAIAENINTIDISRIKKCAKLARIDDFIDSLPNKYGEKVGERGVRISGGQRQRIGIARALYRNSNLIIMDEPTNALDFETENLVMDSIMKLSKNITIIMISHNNNTLKFFDKIIDLNNFK
jgi:ABC-type multidrug transport system fused ATPase/permease subunit